MIEHPVPQNITSYEFRLIGSMTIKQFILLLAGGGLAFLAYSTNLPGFLKWPLVITAVLSGVAMAFLPYEERSLDEWFINFVKAIYRPTKYYWRRTPQPPGFFTYQAVPSAMAEARKPDLSPYRQTQVKQFLSSLGGAAEVAPTDPLDLLGKGGGMDALFSQVQAAPNVAPATREVITKPSLQTRPRPLGSEKRTTTVFAAPALPPQPVPQEKIVAPQPVRPTPPTTAQTPAPAAPAPPRPAPILLEPTQSKLTVETEKPKVAPQPTKTGAEVAELEAVSVQKKTLQKEEPPPAAPIPVAEPTSAYIAAGSAPRAAHTETTIPAVFDKTLPFPSAADKPNILIGMAHATNRSIIPGAIVEIVDAQGNTVRAMKTNALGQFYMSSPLKNGAYTIHTEKEGFSFPTYQFEANGKILDPVDITATA